MLYQNVAIVSCFLGVLLFLKYYLQRKKENSGVLGGIDRKISLTTRLNLSNSSHADILEVGHESFLVVFSKSAQPALLKLEPRKFQELKEGVLNEN
jgi:hypothetical protein|tara:strand:- start:1398 stop:1685 length:288 start_codon:yes stop_codon:yes gene_type:complete